MSDSPPGVADLLGVLAYAELTAFLRFAGRARVVADPGIDRLLRRKYGWQKRALDLLNRRTRTAAWATIEIVDTPAATGSSAAA